MNRKNKSKRMLRFERRPLCWDSNSHPSVYFYLRYHRFLLADSPISSSCIRLGWETISCNNKISLLGHTVFHLFLLPTGLIYLFYQVGWVAHTGISDLRSCLNSLRAYVGLAGSCLLSQTGSCAGAEAGLNLSPPLTSPSQLLRGWHGATKPGWNQSPKYKVLFLNRDKDGKIPTFLLKSKRRIWEIYIRTINHTKMH